MNRTKKEDVGVGEEAEVVVEPVTAVEEKVEAVEEEVEVASIENVIEKDEAGDEWVIAPSAKFRL
uniref:Uncharacterized protein n=1 Tax=viral metagenome TaxID=1070528 RepID=A0A6M3XZ26_9ZZZZ